MVKTTGRVASEPVGDAMLGRVVNALGQPIDGKGPVNTDKIRPIERVASGVISRKSVGNTTLKYDNDVKTFEEDGTKRGAKVQFKEILGVGVAYNF